jgi:hypothetical protein
MTNSGPNWRPGGFKAKTAGPAGPDSGPGPGPEPFPQRGDFWPNEPELTECLAVHLVKPPARVGEILVGQARTISLAVQRIV